MLPDPTATLVGRPQVYLHDPVFALASREPDKTALVGVGAHWSYRELVTRAACLADLLHARGIGSGQAVAIYGHRAPSLVCALLGVLRAGASFVVLDPAYPAARLIDLVRIARCSLLLHIAETPSRSELFEGSAAPVLSISPEALTGGSAGDAPQRERSDIAYIAFTSGTTGRPKAVVGPHAPVSHFLHWYHRVLAVGPDDTFSVLSGLSHDPLLRDIFVPLWLGARAAIPDALTWSDPKALRQWMAAMRITVAHLTPALGRALVEANDAATLPDLRYAVFGGDILTTPLVASFRSLAPRATVVNFYGTTETPQAAAFHVLEGLEAPPDNGAQRIIVPIGRGIDDCQILVLTPGGSLAPAGQPGEVYVRTPYLAHGYLDDEASDRERFLVSPATGLNDDRMYRTGDRGVYDAEGNVTVLGRVDRQVKVGSLRVEPAEIEAHLRSCPGVRDAAVLVCRRTSHGLQPGSPDAGEDPVLVAYAATDRNDADALRSVLAQRLPIGAIPAVIVRVAEIPLTPNGKIDLQALTLPATGGATLDGGGPQDEIEARIIRLYEDVLGVSPIGRMDNFFELGGDSLAAIQLSLHLEDVFARPCSIDMVLEYATVATIAAQLRNRPASDHRAHRAAVDPQSRTPPRPHPDIDRRRSGALDLQLRRSEH